MEIIDGSVVLLILAIIGFLTLGFLSAFSKVDRDEDNDQELLDDLGLEEDE